MKGKKTGGRKRGSQNKLTSNVKMMVLGALEDVGGQAWLTTQAKIHPEAFMRLLGRIIPMQVVGGGDPIVVETIKRVIVDSK